MSKGKWDIPIFTGCKKEKMHWIFYFADVLTQQGLQYIWDSYCENEERCEHRLKKHTNWNPGQKQDLGDGKQWFAGLALLPNMLLPTLVYFFAAEILRLNYFLLNRPEGPMNQR